jgi:4-nitrophenyl phosphatase
VSVVADIDGVVYRGDVLMEGSDRAMQRILDSNLGLFFATNNSSRTPAQVQEKIRRIAGIEVSADSIVNSSQAAAELLDGQETPVFVFGSDAIRHALDELAIPMTDDPNQAEAVIVGMDWDLTYDRLARATHAIRRGARFVATNTDPTFPTGDGLLPGGGAMVAALAVASESQPEVAGKPHEPMRRLLRSRGVGRAWIVGDRVDTDVALASSEEDWTSILVLTGVTEDGEGSGADYVVADLAAAVDLILSQTEG